MSTRYVPLSYFLADGVNRSAAKTHHVLTLPRRVQGVLFDMGNVLYDDTVWRRWLLRLLHQVGLHTQYGGFFRVWDREHLSAVYRGEQTFCAAFEAFLRDAGLSRGQIEEVQAACQGRRRDWDNSIRPMPGIRAALARLVQDGWRLGVLCNSEHPATYLQEQLTRFGMEPYFSTVISSFDLGRALPEEDCYRTALAALQLSAAETAFVGHDAAELHGARAVGLATIAFNYDGDARADCYLNRIEDLHNVLAAPGAPLAVAS